MSFSAWIGAVTEFLRARRRHVVAVAGALLVILVAAWWLASPRGAPTPPKIDPAGAAARSHPVQTPFTAPLGVQSPPPPAKGDELCAYGYVPVVDDVPQIPPEIKAAAQSALGSLAADLAARSTDRDRAMGMFLQMVAAWNTAGTAWRRTHGDCANDDKACQSAADQAMASATAESRRALVRLATSTSDANAYALAIYSCQLANESPINDCALLTAAQWARIEPDNAVPWLNLAADAKRRNDRSALEAALNRASKARYSDPHHDQISELLASDAFAAQSPPVQLRLAISLVGIEAALAFPEYQGLMQYCGGAAQADPNRTQTCGDLAATLIEHGRTVVDVAIGGKVAERIGSTDPRLSALLDQADAIRWQWSEELKSLQEQDHHLLSCNSLQVLRRNAAAQVQFGESGRLRQGLAASGVTVSQAAERWRAERRRLQQQSESVKPTQ
jgi:hypothetical protein